MLADDRQRARLLNDRKYAVSLDSFILSFVKDKLSEYETEKDESVCKVKNLEKELYEALEANVSMYENFKMASDSGTLFFIIFS
jgi:hypothetical protein